jgi:hypothetical protein
VISEDRTTEKRHLARLKALRDILEGYSWMVEPEGDQTHIVIVRKGGEADCIATIHRGATSEEKDLLCGSADALRFLLTLIDRATARIMAIQGPARPAEQVEPPARQKNQNSAAFSAKSLCDQVMFRRFLEGKGAGGPVADARAADTRLKFLLNIQSKSQLNDPGAAREAFYGLRAEYYLWKKGDL